MTTHENLNVKREGPLMSKQDQITLPVSRDGVHRRLMQKLGEAYGTIAQLEESFAAATQRILELTEAIEVPLPRTDGQVDAQVSDGRIVDR